MLTSPPAQTNDLFDAVLALSASALLVYYPMRDTAGALVDFALSHCNPAAQQQLRLASTDAPPFRAHAAAYAPHNGFAQLCDAFVADGATVSLELRYPIDGRAAVFQAEVRRAGEYLVVGLASAATGAVTQPVDLPLAAGAQRNPAEEAHFLYEVLAHAPVAVASLEGPDHVFTYLNPGYAKLLAGRPVLGLPVREALPDLNNQAFPGLLDQVYRTGQPYVGHEMLVQYDRTYTGRIEDTYFNFLYQATRDTAGHITGVILFAYEVTDTVTTRLQVQRLNDALEQTNQELEARVQERTQQVRQQTQRLERLIHEAPAAIALLQGPELVFELLNARYQALFPDRELLGRPVLEALPELRATPLADVLQAVYHTGQTHEGTEAPIPFAGADGQVHTRYFDFIYQARYDADGGIDGLVLFGFDVTERVQRRQQTEALQAELLATAERRVQERQDMIRLFEQAPAAVCLLREPDHQIDYFNATFAQLFPGENLRGRLVGEAYPDAFGAAVIARLDRVYATGNTYTGLEVPLPVAPHPDRPGQPRYFNFTYQAYREQGRIAGVAVFLYEVTEQVRTRQQVQELHEELAAVNQELAATNEELLVSNEELLTSNTRLSHTNADLDTFVYTASHDLKAPIANIEGLLQVLQEEAAAGRWSDTVDHVLTLMQDAVERFRTTLGQLSEISRLQTDTEDAAPVDVAAVVAGVELDLAPLRAVARAEVLVDVAACPALRVPAKTLRSVVYNLLSNALKYRAPERGLVVRIRCWCEAGQAWLSVSDNGLGIDMTRQTELFGLFRRYHTHVEGSGVGLYMVKRMVEHAGGRIDVHSQLGEGSTFTVRFPLQT